MKRPGPISPARPSRPRDDRAERGAAGRDDAAEGHETIRRDVGTGADDTAPIEAERSGSGVRGGVRGRLVDLTRRRDSGADDGDDLTWEPESEGATVGWRDVWRASRARRKALRAESRRFTARQRRRRWWWIGSLGAVAVLIASTIGAAYSPLFAVREVTVLGTDALDAEAVGEALADQLGTPLSLVDHSAVRASLLEFPLIETYQVESRPPHELVVRIVERTPVGAIETDGGFTVVDAAGIALSTSETLPEGQPLIAAEDGVGSAGFAAIGQVIRSLPSDLREQVTGVSATSSQDVTLELGEVDATVIWGSADDSAEKALVLSRLMETSPPSETSTYDVSSPSAVVVVR